MNVKPYYIFGLLLLCIPGTSQDNFNIELVANVKFDDAWGNTEWSNDIWGYVAPDSSEYAIIGTANFTRIFSLEDPKNPQRLVAIAGASAVHRDIKSYGQYIYVTCDQGADGLLIIDMTKAPEVITHKFWKPEILGATLKTCHNLFIDEFGVCYLAGCTPQSPGGIIMLDITTDPLNPTVIGSINERYSHDVMVKENIVYSSEISDGMLTMYDVSDKEDYVTLGLSLIHI